MAGGMFHTAGDPVSQPLKASQRVTSVDVHRNRSAPERLSACAIKGTAAIVPMTRLRDIL
jgi:hypothetical protein